MLKLLRAAIKPQPWWSFFSANHTPGFQPLKSSIFPVKASAKSPKYQFPRNYGSGWGSGSRSSAPGSSSGGPRWWHQFKVPILFTAGVIAFDHTVLAPLFDTSALTVFKQNPEYLVYGIVALNGIIYCLWHVPQTSRFMERYFALYKQPECFSVWGMIAMAFSQGEFWHLSLNMIGLSVFAVPVARLLGSGDFMALYLDSCVLTSLGMLVLPYLTRGPSLMGPSLGASGVIYSMLGILSFLSPNTRFALVPFYYHLSAFWLFSGGLGYNLFRFISRTNNGFDHSGHLAGGLAGIALGWLAAEKVKNEPREEGEEKIKED